MPSIFWDLSHYDFMLYCHKIYLEDKKEQSKIKVIESYFRNIYTIIYNIMPRKGGGKKPQQLWPIPEIDGNKGRVAGKEFFDQVKEWEKSNEFKKRFKLK